MSLSVKVLLESRVRTRGGERSHEAAIELPIDVYWKYQPGHPNYQQFWDALAWDSLIDIDSGDTIRVAKHDVSVVTVRVAPDDCDLHCAWNEDELMLLERELSKRQSS